MVLIKINLPEEIDLVSTNEMYVPHPYRGGKGAYLSKSGPLNKFQNQMHDVLNEVITDSEVNQIRKELENDQFAINLKIKYGLESSRFFSEDSSNYIKAVEDCLSQRLDIDDSRNVKVSIEKELTESQIVSIEISTYRLPYDIPEGKKWKALKKRK